MTDEIFKKTTLKKDLNERAKINPSPTLDPINNFKCQDTIV